jgi:hypothetical protein
VQADVETGAPVTCVVGWPSAVVARLLDEDSTRGFVDFGGIGKEAGVDPAVETAFLPEPMALTRDKYQGR